MPNTAFNNFAALMNAVFVETKRPDLVEQTAQAVFSATLQMHGFDFFPKDIQPALLRFDQTRYIQTLDIAALPFYRALSYIRKDDPTLYQNYEVNNTGLPPLFTNIDGSVVGAGLARKLLEEITPDDIFDEFNCEKTDSFYAAGNTIYIKSSTSLLFANLGYYKWPNMDITNSNLDNFDTAPETCAPLYDSWIASEFPYAIIYTAASTVLTKIGEQDMSRKYDQVGDPRSGKGAGLVWSQIDALVKANIKATGS